jgi:AcrR family transcriptional regulator
MVKKYVRLRGRPRTFDESEAVLQATKVFWTKGYDGATLDDLVDGMGVRRPSIYAIFGDKSTLFMRCLEEYAMRAAVAAQEQISKTDVHDAISGILKLSVENATSEGAPLGCMLVCVAPLVDNKMVRDYVAHMVKQTTAAIEQRLQEGIDAGELPKSFPVALRARQTMDISGGLVVRARIGAPREELLIDAEAGANLILGLECKT